jgi:ribonuclease Z
MTRPITYFLSLALPFFALALPVNGYAESATEALENRGVYFPGTEDLEPDEMRIIACGTGQPTVRPKQAAACWLVELGNGDKFIFDIGAQSMSRISAQKIHYDYLDKVFISHLHMDHYADLAALWIGGLKANRTYPLRVWGPSSYVPELGTRAAVNAMKASYLWDVMSSSRHLDSRGTEIEINEFDFSGVNQVVYEENGVTIRSFPAIHAIDGAVSYILAQNPYREERLYAGVGADARHDCAHLPGAVRRDHATDAPTARRRLPLLQ